MHEVRKKHLATDFEFNFNPPTGKKNPNPRNDSSIFHSSPVQEQSNPQILQNSQKIKCFSQKILDSILGKFQSKLACFSENFCRKKNWILLDDSKADKKYSELFADSSCQLECRSSTGLVNILIVFELSWNCSYRDFLMSQFRRFFSYQVVSETGKFVLRKFLAKFVIKFRAINF